MYGLHAFLDKRQDRENKDHTILPFLLSLTRIKILRRYDVNKFIARFRAVRGICLCLRLEREISREIEDLKVIQIQIIASLNASF